MKIEKRWADPHKIDENDPFFDLLYVTTHRPTRDRYEIAKNRDFQKIPKNPQNFENFVKIDKNR